MCCVCALAGASQAVENSGKEVGEANLTNFFATIFNYLTSSCQGEVQLGNKVMLNATIGTCLLHSWHHQCCVHVMIFRMDVQLLVLVFMRGLVQRL
jgi:hypothetical protein